METLKSNWKTTVFVAQSNQFETHKDNCFACFIESPHERTKPALVFGETEKDTKETAELIVRAVNNHDKLVDVLKKLLKSHANLIGGLEYTDLENEAFNAIKQATS